MANSITRQKVSQLLTLAKAGFTSMITRHCLNSKQQEGKPTVNTLIFTCCSLKKLTNVRAEVASAVTEITVLWDTTIMQWQTGTIVSEETAVSIFRIQEWH
jgi:hypothetical protein